MPKQIPKNGIFFSRACLIQAIFPSVPLFPKPPGIKIPETFSNIFFIFLLLILSDSF